MDKQELIKKIKDISLGAGDHGDTKNEHESEYALMAYILDLVNRLDEPQKVKVPAFVAEWFEKHKKYLEITLACLMPNIRTKVIQEKRPLTEFEKWANNAKNKPFETIIRMKDGYEVEKEPKWKIINDDKYCLTSIEAGYGNPLHWAFDSTKKRPILFDNEETAMYTTYITGGIVEKVEV